MTKIKSKVRVFTSQYSYRGDDRLDITIGKSKRGSLGFNFAPTWNMVMSLKDGSISEEEYTERYNEILDNIHKDVWNELFLKDKVTLVCFCKKGDFCHRVLLAGRIEEMGGVYIGER